MQVFYKIMKGKKGEKSCYFITKSNDRHKKQIPWFKPQHQ